MDVAVMVPTFRRPRDLEKCLDGLERQEHRPVEIVVVVREGDAESTAVVASRKSDTIRSVSVGVPGVVAAMNAGLRAATAEIVAITDDDAVPRPDWLRRMVAHFAERTEVAGVGGRDVQPAVEARGETRQPLVGLVPRFGKTIANHHVGIGPAREVDCLKGVNCAYRRDAIAPIGFDEDLLGSGAQVHWELSLGLALRKRGYSLIYDPEIVVDHYVAERFDEDRRSRRSWIAQRNQTYNETLIRLRHANAVEAIALIAWSLLVGTTAQPGLVQFVRYAPRDRVGSALAFSASAAGVVQAFFRESVRSQTLRVKTRERSQ